MDQHHEILLLLAQQHQNILAVKLSFENEDEFVHLIMTPLNCAEETLSQLMLNSATVCRTLDEPEMADRSFSDKKRSRLQALESRLSSPSSVNKNTNTPLPRVNSFLKSPAAPTATTSTASTATGDFQGPAYAKLSKLAFDGPVANCLQLSTEKNGRIVIDSIIRELVRDSGKAVRDLDGVLDSKVQDRVLLLDNPAGQGKAVERARRRSMQGLAKRSSKHLSKRQQKLLGSYNLPLQYQK
ncbi:hypothetical protein L7F22_032908 [Adiantum nelumboides]|nr:hypothetical protein [Adiantum nelumboides]